MKTAYRFLFLWTAVWSANSAIAGNFDVEIHCSPERIDQSVKKASDGGVNETNEHWIYDVTIENKTFKELTNLDLNYVIFFKQEQLGVKAAATPRQQSGSFSIDSLKPHEQKSLSTNPVELNKSNLVDHWHYESGAKPNAQDSRQSFNFAKREGGIGDGAVRRMIGDQ